MKVLVLGGTRFVGFYTVHRLVELGHDVAVFHRGSTEPVEMPDVRHIHGDRSELESYRNEFAEFAPNAVIDMLPLNKADAETVVSTIGGITPWLIGISSQDVYATYGTFIRQQDGPIETEPTSESSALRAKLYPYRDRFPADHPMHDYDKIPAEQIYLSQFDLFGTVMRLPCVYGPNDAQHRTAPYLKRMLDRRDAILLSEQMATWRWTRGYVENVANAIALATTTAKAVGRVYNVGEPTALSEKEWVEAIGRTVGWDGEVKVLANTAMPPHLRVEENYEQSLVADTTRIRDELGYEETIDRNEALARTIDWERANLYQALSEKDFDYAAEDIAIGSA